MTLFQRNTFFKIGIAFCLTVTLLILAASFVIIPIYSSMEGFTLRPAGIFQFLTGWFLGSSFIAVHASLILVVLFSLSGILFIHFFFQRTSAPEILYVSFFTLSLSFEVIRLLLPLHLLYSFPSFYLLIVWRALLFARYFGVFSLFTASVCAAGLEVKKNRNMILIIIIAALVITLGIPVDAQAWDTSLNMAKGFNSMFLMIEAVLFIITVISFFIAVKVRGSGEYAYVALGAALALSGRNILLGSDNFAGPAVGILLLSFGTWFTCIKLHKIHLWL